MKKWMAMAAVLALGVPATAAQAADKLKACWVYVGPVGDFGYSYQHDVGRKAVDKALGDKVETVFLENVAEGPDAERAIELAVTKYCSVRDSLDPVRHAIKSTTPKEKPQAHSKYWQDLLGQVGGPVRRPMLQLTQAEKEATRAAFEACGLNLSPRRSSAA